MAELEAALERTVEALPTIEMKYSYSEPTRLDIVKAKEYAGKCEYLNLMQRIRRMQDRDGIYLMVLDAAAESGILSLEMVESFETREQVLTSEFDKVIQKLLEESCGCKIQ